MEQQDILFDSSESAEALTPGVCAERVYLDCAISVAKGRALLRVTDGQKPMQRCILFAIREVGLRSDTKSAKSVRVVDGVSGKFHPRGDQSAYDALMCLAQDFSLRYPLIDGQGNLGSCDGNDAAATHCTEARLTSISHLSPKELDQGIADSTLNYDGSIEEPKPLSARLPFILLNGASGTAVGMATEVPSYSLRGVAAVTVAFIRDDKLTGIDLMQYMPGPGFPGGGQIISSAADIAQVYESGRDSPKVCTHRKIEELVHNQQQLVVNELLPNISLQEVLEEIEELTSPKVRMDKKSLSPDQFTTEQTMLGLPNTVRDESGKDTPVRLMFKPKSKNIDQQEFANVLLAHMSLESGAAINLMMTGTDGRSRQKGLAEILHE